jgi:RTX calcium-binding nonapeptide repeat (4 copies)
VVVLAAMTAPLASGHPSPPGCTQAAFSFEWGPGLDIVHRNGDVVPVTVEVGNDNIGSGVCDVTDATVTLQFPNPDGTSGGRLFTLATDVNFPAGSAPKTFGTKKLTIDFDPEVFRGFVTISVTGVWHLSEPDPDPLTSSAGRPVVISRPHVTLSVSPTVSLIPPFTVTYDYFAENDSPDDPGVPVNPTPEVVGAVVADDNCSPLTFTGGDTTISDPPIINEGEMWSYQCTRSLPTGSLVDTATFTGFSTRDGRPWPKRIVRTAFCGRQFATIVGTDKSDAITGTPGPDVIVPRDGNDVVEGLGGDDIICGGAGSDTLRGMAGADTLRGEGSPDKLIGGAGIDTLIGGPGTDVERQ